MSTFNPLSGIKGTPVGFSCSRKASMVFDLAVRAVGSAPTGQRALLLAITYRGTLWARTPHALVQPKYDAELMKSYLLETGKWAESDITVLTDAEGTPENRLPTHANIMREIEALGKSNCQNVFFLYTGHAGQRLQPKQSTQSRVVPKGAPGRRLVEEYDQYIIPIDAVTGPELEDINQDLVILDDVLHECLISTLHARSTFLAILDTCHSATLFGMLKARYEVFLRRSFRKVVVEPLWEILGKATDGGLANADSFNISDSCNGLCPRRKNLICPIAVTISACKDRQHIYENGPSLTETIVRLLRSKPTAGLPDVIDAVLINYKRQQKHMKNLEKQYKKAGNTVMMQKMREMRLQAGQLMPEVASTAALPRHHSSDLRIRQGASQLILNTTAGSNLCNCWHPRGPLHCPDGASTVDGPRLTCLWCSEGRLDIILGISTRDSRVPEMPRLGFTFAKRVLLRTVLDKRRLARGHSRRDAAAIAKLDHPNGSKTYLIADPSEESRERGVVEDETTFVQVFLAPSASYLVLHALPFAYAAEKTA
ncbi:hypothetical protein BKA70DRAFT_1427056 [Coprinopsis sp. MPI-PUGE-AT-0042]|nr:hypothetical protein BKA70DRAFT_1427056 [Coprinopsis sp. MPI-PUGE-AT-0042]